METEFPTLFRIRLVFEAQTALAPPAAIGAMWRGAFGKRLRKIDPSAYARLFDPVGRGGVAAENMPSPFVLDPDVPPDGAVGPGERMSLDVTLIGEAAEDAASVVDALDAAGSGGLGKTRGVLQLYEAGAVWCEQPEDGPALPPVPPTPTTGFVALKSPWSTGRELTVKGFQGGKFLEAVRTRINGIGRAYGSGAVLDGGPLIAEAAAVELWHVPRVRWSASRQAEIDISGTQGSFLLSVPNDRIWAVLWWSQWLGIGAHTAYGNGALRVHPVYD